MRRPLGLLLVFCAAAGLRPPADAQGDGENMLPALTDTAFRRTRPVFWRISGNDKLPDYWPDLAVREGDWKLVTTFDGRRVELHDLGSDRAEEASRDRSREQPALVARLTKLALAWQATLPTKADPACTAPPK